MSDRSLGDSQVPCRHGIFRVVADLLASVTHSDEWPVETHGLTKRFRENIAVNDVEDLPLRASSRESTRDDLTPQSRSTPATAR
jgi:hypothetical protein